MALTFDLHTNEIEFLNACIAKEQWAQKELYEAYYGTMKPLCRRYANNDDDALDILHEGFIKVFRHISKYQAGTSLTSWIKRIMINTSIDYYRKVSRRRTEDIDKVYNMSSDAPDAVSLLSAKEILAALQVLTPAYRSVFNLYVIEGFPHKNVAEILGITESTSRSNLVKARSKLREILLAKGISRHGR